MAAEALLMEKLNLFKEREKPETVLLLEGDKQLIKIVVAWSNTETRQAKPLSALASDSERGVWQWLWENTEYSEEELCTNSSVPQYSLKSKLALLIGNRALYPDGTVNSFVQRYLRERVLKLFESRRTTTKRK